MATENQKRTFAKNFSHYLELKGITRADVSRLLGYPETTLANWANGVNYPRIDKIQELADFFGIKKSDLIEDKIDAIINRQPDLHPIHKIRSVPILGTIACGTPIWAEENFEGYVGIDPMHMDGEFALICKGDSMVDANIHNGDIVLMKKTSDVEDGKIAAVLIEDETTLKKVYKKENLLVLQPCNSSYSPIVYSYDEAEDKGVQILGECVGIYHAVKE
ncbi:LexA family transcriptional regulator [Murdochiella massiliensis]|uniref:LexA family transcriptional regulator n=1 Tax=Murdochiella massiliensis TaxID=1673723 RepID=UPI0008349F1C|nr:S24 family peptidase [Murdochiella massiliensis]